MSFKDLLAASQYSAQFPNAPGNSGDSSEGLVVISNTMKALWVNILTTYDALNRFNAGFRRRTCSHVEWFMFKELSDT